MTNAPRQTENAAKVMSVLDKVNARLEGMKAEEFNDDGIYQSHLNMVNQHLVERFVAIG